MNRNTILIGVAVVGVIIVASLVYVNTNHGFSLFGQSDEQIGKLAVDYINNNQLASTPASLVSVSEVSGLIKVKIKIGTQEFDSYATKDGKFLFPQAFEMTPAKSDTKTPATSGTTSGKTAADIIAAIQKTDKPLLEAYIVSDCPFGLQMQRLMADAIKSAPALASNVAVRYIGSVSGGKVVSMHGTEEGTENLNQICIREEQPTKYWNYVSCYMKKSTGTMANGMPYGDSAGCQASTGIDTAKLNACVSDSKRGLAYAQKDFDLAGKYNVSGSPTLVLNGTTVDEFTADNQPVFGGRASDEVRAIVCDASKTQPSFCSTKLNTAQAAASFSATYASGSSTGSNTNCAPAQ